MDVISRRRPAAMTRARTTTSVAAQALISERCQTGALFREDDFIFSSEL